MQDARLRRGVFPGVEQGLPQSPSHSFSAAISMGVTWLFWYLARPAVSFISRNLWDRFCNYWYVGHYEGFFGTIGGYIRWGTNCMPLGEDITVTAYIWRDTIITAIVGGCTYLFSHWYQKIKLRAHNIAREGLERLQQRLDNGEGAAEQRGEAQQPSPATYTPARGHRRSASTGHSFLAQSEVSAPARERRPPARFNE